MGSKKVDRIRQSCGGMARRRFLQASGALAVAAMPVPALAGVLEERTRQLDFINVRTDESLSVTYWRGGRYRPKAIDQVSHLLRDVPSGEVKPIDPQLIDLLYRIHQKLGSDAPFAVISGYRTPRTNRLLAKRKSGVATHSLHMDGMAVDLLLPDRPLADVAEAAWSYRAGGVGYYPSSNFVHLDVGPVRRWTAQG